ncbi:serine hydrolase [Microbacterium sp. SS28]|uniref:serine hydrolase domain-containing protein n=1 Tax=Microbacterium sp. SS28 TaxID=2919948 RepID=UPI001FA95D8B|nr:serine hydrolase [Microbacterium sp. SS28]
MSPSPRRPTRSARRTRIIPAILLLVVAVSACTADPAPDPSPTPTTGIDRSVEITLEEHDPHHALRAVLVHEHGEPVYERYVESGPDDYWDIRSVTKSIVATLVGVAVDRGLIRDVDATLGELLPRWADDLTAETSAIPLSAVLTHTANFTGVTDVWSTPDPVGAILANRALLGPGDGSFFYSAAGSHILAAVVAEASGMPVLEFARQNLFDPLGIPSEPALEPPIFVPPEEEEALFRAYEDADFAWPVDVQGVHLGSARIKLRPSDLARIGQLYLDGGRWEGVQVVSESWIAQATAAHVQTEWTIEDYGFQWWVDVEGGYACAMGMGGTIVIVHPERDAVVVVASEIAAGDQRGDGAMAPGNAIALAEAILDELGAAD